MADSAQIKTISNKHNAIMDFMLANPHLKMKHIAAKFKVGQTHLSLIVHSDCFQAKLREKQDAIFNTFVCPMGERLEAISHVALDRLEEKVETSDDPRFLLDATNSVLKSLGYTGQTGGAVNVQAENVLMVSTNVLNQARENFGRRKSEAAIDAEIIEEGELQTPTPTEAQQASGAGDLGGSSDGTPALGGGELEGSEGGEG